MGTSQEKDGFWMMTVGEREASLQKLEQVIRRMGGNPRELLGRFRSDEEYTHHVAELMLRCGVEIPSKYRHLREMFGRRIFDHLDWASYYGIKIPESQLPEFPWGNEILESEGPLDGKVKDTHFAFLGLPKKNPLSIKLLMKHHTQAVFGKEPGKFCYEPPEKFQDSEPCEFRWYLICDQIAKGEESSDVYAARALPKNYSITLLAAEAAHQFLYFRKTGQNYPDKRLAFCRSTASLRAPDCIVNYHIPDTTPGIRIWPIDDDNPHNRINWQCYPWFGLSISRIPGQ